MVTTVDDGKVNVLSFEIIAGLRGRRLGRPRRSADRWSSTDGMVACRPASTWPWSTAGTRTASPHSSPRGPSSTAPWSPSDSGDRVLHGSCARWRCAPPAERGLPDRAERAVPAGPQRDQDRDGLAQLRGDPGHASTRAPVPDRGHHVRRGRLAGAGRGDGLPRRDSGRSPARACALATSWPRLPPEPFAVTKRRIRRTLQQELEAEGVRATAGRASQSGDSASV